MDILYSSLHCHSLRCYVVISYLCFEIVQIALVSYIRKNSDCNEESAEGITLTGLYIEGGLWEVNEGLIPSRYYIIILIANIFYILL